MAKSGANEFSGQIVRLMQKYSRGLGETTEKIVKEVGNEAKKKIRQGAPKRTGDYRKSLKINHFPVDSSGVAEFTIYSDEHWQITHLLEFGHEIWHGGKKNPSIGEKQGKRYEEHDVDAIPHFAPVQEWANEEVMKRLEKELKG